MIHNVTTFFLKNKASLKLGFKIDTQLQYAFKRPEEISHA